MFIIFTGTPKLHTIEASLPAESPLRRGDQRNFARVSGEGRQDGRVQEDVAQPEVDPVPKEQPFERREEAGEW